MPLTAWLCLACVVLGFVLGLWLGSVIWGSRATARVSEAEKAVEKDAEDGAAAKAELAAREKAAQLTDEEEPGHVSDADLDARVLELRDRGRAGK